MGEKVFSKEDIGLKWRETLGVELPKTTDDVYWYLLTHHRDYGIWVIVEKDSQVKVPEEITDWSKVPQEPIREMKEPEWFKGFRERQVGEGSEYADWFKGRTRPNATHEEHLNVHKEFLESIEKGKLSNLSREVAELKRSNTFLWVIVLFNAVMGIVFGSRDLFGW